MNPIVIVAIVAFVVIDIVVMLVVVRPILARRGAASVAGVTSLSDLLQVTKAIQDEAREYLRANWSGDALALPGVVEPLLTKLEADLQARGLPAPRANLKVVLTQLAIAEGRASAREVREAMKQVA